jgi:hypothetical protein
LNDIALWIHCLAGAKASRTPLFVHWLQAATKGGCPSSRKREARNRKEGLDKAISARNRWAAYGWLPRKPVNYQFKDVRTQYDNGVIGELRG